MNMKTVIPLGLAIVLGLVAAILVRNTISHHNSAATSNSNMVAVVVAKGDVEPGKALDKEDLVIARVPAEIAPGHVFSDPNQLVGRVVISPLSKGQTIMESLLAVAGTGSGLQALIPPGMRAVTLEVSEFSSVGGMLEPGCRVDLVSTMNDPKVHEAMAKTVLQNVKITAIGRSMSPPHPVDGQPMPPPSNNVTLLLTPKQVQTLELAQMSSRPWLVLRSSRDNVEQQLEPTPLAMLRGEPAADGVDNSAQIQPTAGPATPINPFQPVDQVIEQAPTTIKRTVIFIHGGVETTQTIMVPAPRTDTAATVDQLKPVDGN